MISCDQVLPAAEECTSTKPDLPRSQHGLAALPLELLEETASYLSTSDAAKAVTVCSVLHEGFAHRVWRHLGTDRADGVKRIPASAWQRYGYLVRTAYISAKTVDSIPLEHISRIVRLTVELDCVETVALNKAVKDMTSIQSVNVIQGDNQYLEHRQLSVMDDWIVNAKDSGQTINIEWDLIINGGEMVVLCYATSDLIASSQHTYKLAASKLSRVQPDEMVRVATSLTTLDLSGNDSIVSFFGSSGATNHFPILRKLVLKFNVRTNSKQGSDWVTFNPSQFPMLDCLEISFYSGVVEHIYAHTWTTITELSLHSFHDGEAFRRLIQKLPNLARLNIMNSGLSLPIDVLAVHLPRLEYITIFATDCAYLNTSEPTARLPNLKELSLTSTYGHDEHLMPMGDRLLSTILDRFPNLQSLELIGYSYSKIDFKQFSGRANQSVRFVSIVDDTSVKSVYTIAKLLTLFPNTKQLTFNELSAADLQTMKQLSPGVVVIAKEIKEYENDNSDLDSNFDIDIESDSDSDSDSGSGYDDTENDDQPATPQCNET